MATLAIGIAVSLAFVARWAWLAGVRKGYRAGHLQGFTHGLFQGSNLTLEALGLPPMKRTGVSERKAN
jgi:hypothetical protein